jgi:EAL domain-containing protein (putative c-di-GMP-specific phosphodiesterase class I)
MMEIAATHHLAYSNNIFTDVIRESNFAKQKAYQVFKQASDDCNFLNTSLKQIEAQTRDLAKKRDAAAKKLGPEFIDRKLIQDLENLGKKYQELKTRAVQLEDGFKAQLQDSFSNVKDDVRKSFVHFISLLKNIEYDLNAELEKFDKDELTVEDSLKSFESLPIKEIKFDFDDISKSNSTKNQSLTESMINMLGFNNVDVDAEGSELVLAA